ncbi:ABC transporter ATP-binding protein [Savagea sp. SN6]|uniref:ABC transporter ATP-binding protein n=1 Tax=Savagea serpentis TaxID=2785297 RepID=A0A8J7GM48_9BACL|nr:ABC transporter ATP-binding protein [Savagea serpentis]MBF4501488.1 ABC transporter ATP-binding protein [Savagea serpentis]
MIEAIQLRKRYGNKDALKNVTCHIPKNSFVGLIGRNGSGKTTFLKLLAGESTPTSGQLFVGGEQPFDNIQVSANTMLIDDEFNLVDNARLTEGLDAMAHFYPKFDRLLAERLLAYFEIPTHARQSKLSKGMNMTYRFVLGLCARTDVTYFDEPTNGMDASVRKDVYRLLLKDYVEHPRTIIVSSHHIEELEQLLSYVVVLHDGQTVYVDEAEQLQQRYVELIGSAATIQSVIAKSQVVTTFGEAPVQHVIVPNELTAEERHQLQQSNVQIKGVGLSDAYIYMTEHRKGGIDDVYNDYDADSTL